MLTHVVPTEVLSLLQNINEQPLSSPSFFFVLFKLPVSDLYDFHCQERVTLGKGRQPPPFPAPSPLSRGMSVEGEPGITLRSAPRQ